MFCQALSAIGTGVIIGFVYSWKMTLFILAFAPLMIASGLIATKMMTGGQGSDREGMENAGQVLYGRAAIFTFTLSFI